MGNKQSCCVLSNGNGARPKTKTKSKKTVEYKYRESPNSVRSTLPAESPGSVASCGNLQHISEREPEGKQVYCSRQVFSVSDYRQPLAERVEASAPWLEEITILFGIVEKKKSTTCQVFASLIKSTNQIDIINSNIQNSIE